MSLLDELTIEDLDCEQKELAECIGLAAYKKLVENYAGSYVYVCKPDTVTKNARNMQIEKEFNGYNYLELAKKFNLSEGSVRRIISAMLEAHQMSLFDDLSEK